MNSCGFMVSLNGFCRDNLRVTYHVEAKPNHLKSSKSMAQPSLASQLLQAEAEQLLASIRRFAASQMCDPFFKNSLGCIRMNREIGNK